MKIQASAHHSFDVNLAAEYGIEGAILIHHFQHWIMINKRQKKHYIEGRTWTYQTLEYIAAHFPYFSVDQIKRIINKLIEKKILIKGNFNKTSFDRTLWYAFEDETAFSIVRNRQMEKTKSSNGKDEIARPIPDTKNICLNKTKICFLFH